MSKLINCPDCGHQVSNKAAACPKCGREINSTVNKFIWQFFGTVFLLAIIYQFAVEMYDQYYNSPAAKFAQMAADAKESARVIKEANEKINAIDEESKHAVVNCESIAHILVQATKQRDALDPDWDREKWKDLNSKVEKYEYMKATFPCP